MFKNYYLTKRIIITTILLLIMSLSSMFFIMQSTGSNSPAYGFATYQNANTERIDYSRKVETGYTFSGGLPELDGVVGGDCVPVAGGTILTYWNRKYTELIPNYVSGKVVGNKVVYTGQTAETKELIRNLGVRMNVTSGSGANVNSFKTGLNSYLSSKSLKANYSPATSSLLIWSWFDYDKYVNLIREGTPVFLGLEQYHVVGIDSAPGYDYQTYMYPGDSVPHAMVGCGYKQISYYREEVEKVWDPVWYNLFRTKTVVTEVNFRNDTFIAVASGVDQLYINIDRDVKIADAFGVYVYK